MRHSDSTAILNEVILTELRETRGELKVIGEQVSEVKIQNIGMINTVTILEKEIREKDVGIKDRVRILYDSYLFKKRFYKISAGVFMLCLAIYPLIIMTVKK